MDLVAGTSGYCYKEWRGHFYPDKHPESDMLRYYAERFRTVEINNTFYRMPAASVLAQWASQVPDGFAFTLKASRRITHVDRLQDRDDYLAEFVRRAAMLGDKLGAMLFQLPPFLRKDVPRLSAFLDLLPVQGRFAFEFRHDSWHDDEVFDALRQREALLCVTDTDEGDTPFVTTATEAYVRLRRTHYDEADLATWVDRIAASGVERTFVYFMHEDEALGTRFAAAMNALWDARTNDG
jgi:uncharacterized protein YecE (DUF72 family)